MKLILTFSLPILVGSIFQQFYSMVDSIIVGRVLGEQDLAAIGATGSLSFLVIGWVMGFTGGFGVLISQRFGAGDQKGVRHYMAMSLYLCIMFAVVVLLSKPFGFAGICWAEPIAWIFALIPLIPVYFIRQKRLNH